MILRLKSHDATHIQDMSWISIGLLQLVTTVIKKVRTDNLSPKSADFRMFKGDKFNYVI
jgi:hypothetical protein